MYNDSFLTIANNNIKLKLKFTYQPRLFISIFAKLTTRYQLLYQHMIQSIIQVGTKLRNQPRQKDVIKYSHYIDILLLSTTYISIASCLIRPDYNFAIAFFAYFLKQQKLNLVIVKLEIALFLLTIVFDIAYAIIDIRVWYKVDDFQQIWQTIFPMHAFLSGTFLLEFIFKIVIIILLFILKGLLTK